MAALPPFELILGRLPSLREQVTARRGEHVELELVARRHPGEANETAFVEPLATGLTQLTGILPAIEGGSCVA